MKANFGLGIATGTEGLMYPIPYSSARDVVELSVYAEKLGFHSVWGNDHITTQNYVREEFQQPPRYYAPLLTLAAIAERTTTLKVATALLVVPFRNPLVMAKEIATLDQLSGGRLLLGVGLGAYREEFEAEFGGHAQGMIRGEMLDESIAIMHKLFTEDNITYTGKYFDIQNAQCFPHPIQAPFAFYFGGNSTKGYHRVAQWGTGWLPALLTPSEVKAGVDAITEECAAVGRSIADIDVAPQISVSIAKTHEEAVARYEKSQIYRHSCSLGKSTMKGKDATNYLERNLIGSVDEVRAQVERYIEAGVTTFSALIFADNNLDETRDHMQFFSEEIISKYSK
ncbi:probable F420-dependent oxidoreductase, Rv2161c family [Oscillibacter sp. PC13]|uniref:LLM class flavin-dependent oxidoreductase n=1 Tax=Oscillibacter sp. PC13 TaxID=1855299 RepID=UPI0008E56CA7|nr:LLM class flavin-dependent oxidoreductase [Oscillibacter sp. PC13]SFP49175.1 probable F420-dependent oxidoreductase, Rv2161c family [Oscillibacter sp. PC13]